MKTIMIVAPLFVGIIILLYTIIANLLRVWLAHRIKLAMLERLQRDPDRPKTTEQLHALVDEPYEGAEQKTPVDYVIVGGALAIVGFGTALVSYVWGQGQTSVGIYFGGVACVAVGAILILLGFLIRYLSRLPMD